MFADLTDSGEFWEIFVDLKNRQNLKICKYRHLEVFEFLIKDFGLCSR